MKRFIARLFIVVISIVTCGCATSPQRTVSLTDTIIATKHSFVDATDILLFEEFAKYRVLKNTFDLYKLSSISYEISSNIEDTSKKSAGIKPTLTSVELSLSKELQAVDKKGATIKFTLTNIVADKDTYEAVKKIFDNSEYDNIYSVATVKNYPKDLTALNITYYYTPILIKDSKGNKVVALLTDINKFRKLKHEVHTLAGVTVMYK